MNRWAGLVAGLVAATGACAPAMAQEPPAGFVWYVLNQLNSFGFDIEDPTNRPPLVTEAPAGVLEPVDANGDGRTDWLIRWPEAMQFCGTGGCRVTLYIGVEDGFVRAFDRQALRFDIRTVDGDRQVDAMVHRLECNGAQEECVRSWTWNPEANRLQRTPLHAGLNPSRDVPVITWSGDSGE